LEAKLPIKIKDVLIHQNISLKSYNTFQLDVNANYLAEIVWPENLIDVFENQSFAPLPKLVLGGGSNVLFRGHQRKAVLLMRIDGIEVVREDAHHAYVKVGAGVVWHQLVLWSLDQGLSGLENLSLIPGTVGAAPMQNIGAYGVEQKELFYELEAFEISSKQFIKFKKEDCQFGYRHSIFKSKLKDKFIITSVTYKLSKRPIFNTSYGAIKSTLEDMGVETLTTKDISNAVIHIRSAKLPDPAVIGNAGSFFKNPVIEEVHYEALKAAYDDIPSYPISSGWIKVPAAWLIEQTGWKGKKSGHIGVHDKQPLVLVNFGDGNGNDLFKLSELIQSSVQKKFGVALQREVNVY
jgi:UDP-N-acetylmuramate dehydrogenase